MSLPVRAVEPGPGLFLLVLALVIGWRAPAPSTAEARSGCHQCSELKEEKPRALGLVPGTPEPGLAALPRPAVSTSCSEPWARLPRWDSSSPILDPGPGTARGVSSQAGLGVHLAEGTGTAPSFQKGATPGQGALGFPAGLPHPALLLSDGVCW